MGIDALMRGVISSLAGKGIKLSASRDWTRQNAKKNGGVSQFKALAACVLVAESDGRRSQVYFPHAD